MDGMSDNTPAMPPLPPLNLDAIHARAHMASLAADTRDSNYGMVAWLTASAADVPELLSYINALLARVLTPEEAHVALVWAGPDPECWYDQRDRPLVDKLGHIAGDR